jgi:hypothetical protein
VPWRIRLATEIHSLQLKVIEVEKLKHHLQVHLELSKNRGDGLHSEIETLQGMIFSGLIRVNQDFREVTKMFDRSQVQVLLYELALAHQVSAFTSNEATTRKPRPQIWNPQKQNMASSVGTN